MRELTVVTVALLESKWVSFHLLHMTDFFPIRISKSELLIVLGPSDCWTAYSDLAVILIEILVVNSLNLTCILNIISL